MPKRTPTVRLTVIAIEHIKYLTGVQVTYWDPSTRGFGVRVSQGGSKTFLVMDGPRSNRRRTSIGRYPTISLSQARAEAKRILAEHTLGKERMDSLSYKDAVEEFIAACTKKNKPRTVADYERLLKRHFKLGTTALSDITQSDITRRIDKLQDTPSEANHAFAAARAFFNWAYRSRLLVCRSTSIPANGPFSIAWPNP